MRPFKMTLAYDGTNYAGWQIQAGPITIQQTLEEALQKITGVPIRIVASGRTDAGVHAFGQVVSFASSTQLSCHDLRNALNAITPHDLFVREVSNAPDGFHAIRDATSKRYRYIIQDGLDMDIFSRGFSWHVRSILNESAMQQAATFLIGQHDFASFQAAGSERATTIRKVIDLSVERKSAELSDRIILEISADGFLYNMVRNIVGTLVEVGKGHKPAAWIKEVLAAKDRRAAGTTAPAQGLFLLSVDYGF